MNMKRLLASMMGLPLWIQLWLMALMGVNMASVLFLDTPVGFWTAVAFGVVCMFNMPTMMIQSGMTRLLSAPHLVWVPLLIFIYGQLSGVSGAELSGPIRFYAIAVFTVNGISLLFDVLEIYRWIGGRREILGIEH